MSGNTYTVRPDAVLEVVADIRRQIERAQGRLKDLGMVGLFIPGFRTPAVVDHLDEAQRELQRMEIAIQELPRG